MSDLSVTDENATAMNDEDILKRLESISSCCIHRPHTRSCPFRLLNCLSYASRHVWLNQLTPEQAQTLLALVESCSCRDVSASLLIVDVDRQLEKNREPGKDSVRAKTSRG